MKGLSLIFTCILLSLLSCLGCDEPPPITNPPVEEPALYDSSFIHLEWFEEIKTDFSEGQSDWLTVLNDGIIYDDLWLQTNLNDTAKIIAIDIDSGEEVWSWKCESCDYVLNNEIIKSALDTSNGIYLARSSKEIFAFDLLTKSLLWKFNLRGNNLATFTKLNVVDGIVHISATRHVQTESAQGVIMGFDTRSGRIVYNITLDNMSSEFYEEIPSPATVWTSSNGDSTYLIFNVGLHDATAPPGNPQHLIAFDLETLDTVWYKPDFGGTITDMHHSMVMEGHRGYVGSSCALNCINLRTGERIWTWDEIECINDVAQWGGTHSRHILDDELIFTNPGGSFDVYALNKRTGELVWHNPEAAATCADRGLLVNDVLVYQCLGNGSITFLDKHTGQTLSRLREFNGWNFQFHSPSYDMERDLFVTTVGKGVIGFKIK